MKQMSLKQFIEEYKPVKQHDDRTYRKYFIINDLKVSTLYKLAKTYNCNIFTGTQDNNLITLHPGRRFSLDNSFFIVVENGWEDYYETLTVDVKAKK